MSADDAAPVQRSPDLRLPIYDSPEPAAIALARAGRYGAWRAAPPSITARPDGIRHDEAAALIATALGRGDSWLPADDVAALLDCYGLPMAEPGTDDGDGTRGDERGVEMVVG